MKKLTLIVILLTVSIMLSAQSKNLSCKVIVDKSFNLKSIVDDKNAVKLNSNEELDILSWRTSNTQSEYGTLANPQFIVNYAGEEYGMDMNDLKKVVFSEPASVKEFWEIFSIENEVIQGIAKNGIRYDLRAELDDESIEFIGLLNRNQLIFQDEYVEDYIQSLLYRIHQGKLDDKRTGTLNLIIMKESVPNAYCLPNGSIFVTTGLLSVLDSEEELMGVLAHEVAHFVGDHHINNLLELEKKERNAEFWAGVATVLAAAGDAYLASNYDNYYFGTLTYSTAIFSTAIAQSVVDRFGIDYSHEQEFAADEAAFEIMAFTGKNPAAFVSAMHKISEYMYRTGNYEIFLNTHTHPSMGSRLAELPAEPEKFYSNGYQSVISFVNTYNARIEFDKKHFKECVNLVDKNINAKSATEEDYILKAMAIRVLHADKEHNLEALDYLNMAENLQVEPNSYIHKQKAITYLRLDQNVNALTSLEQYLADLESILESGVEAGEIAYLKNEISWSKRMIYKTR